MKMKRCPECKSGAEFTNEVEFRLKEAAAFAAAAAAGFVIKSLRHNPTGTVNEIIKNVMDGVHKHYKCTNPQCLHEWNEDWNQ